MTVPSSVFSKMIYAKRRMGNRWYFCSGNVEKIFSHKSSFHVYRNVNSSSVIMQFNVILPVIYFYSTQFQWCIHVMMIFFEEHVDRIFPCDVRSRCRREFPRSLFPRFSKLLRARSLVNPRYNRLCSLIQLMTNPSEELATVETSSSRLERPMDEW